MSDTSAPEIRPATDEEIATIVEMGWSCDCSTKGPNHPWMCVMVFGPRLIERIEADRAAAQERDRKIAELVQERDDDTALIRRLNATVAAQAEENLALKRRIEMLESDRGQGSNPSRDPDHNDR